MARGSPRVLSGQGMPALGADPVHDRVVRAVVIELEVHAMAPQPGHAQDMPALGAGIGRP